MSQPPRSKRVNMSLLAKNRRFPTNVAEPMHRQTPANVSSGISQRHAANGVSAIKLICKYYVDKCSGKYSDNVMSARYVHQLADEVLVQLEALQSSMSSGSKAEEAPQSQSASLSQRMEEILREWTEHFPPSLGKLGSPKAVAARIEALTQTVESLNEKIKLMQAKHQTEVGELQSQVMTSRTGCLLEREQTGDALARKERQFQEVLRTEQRHWEELLAASEQRAGDKLTRAQRAGQTRSAGLEADRARLQEALDRQIETNTRLHESSKSKSRALKALSASMAKGATGAARDGGVIEMMKSIEEEEAGLEERFQSDTPSAPSSPATKQRARVAKRETSPSQDLSALLAREMEQRQQRETLELKQKGLESKLAECQGSVEHLQRVEVASREHIEFLIRCANVNLFSSLCKECICDRRCASLEDVNSNLRDALAKTIAGTDSAHYAHYTC